MRFQDVLVHSFTKTDLTKSLPANESESNYIFFRDYIPRHSSSAAIVVQGVKEKESRSLTTMWTILGFPLTSVIIPVWILEDGTMPMFYKLMKQETLRYVMLPFN